MVVAVSLTPLIFEHAAIAYSLAVPGIPFFLLHVCVHSDPRP